MTRASSTESQSVSGPGDFTGPSPLAGRIVVDVNIPEARWLDHLPWLETLAGEAAREACLAGGKSLLSGEATVEISLTFGDDDFVRELNAKHRGIDKPTNVLSFPGASPEDISAGLADGPRPELLLGDLMLGLEIVLAEAEEQGKRPGDHVAHLVVHGVLHLLGFDHAGDEEARHMERLEVLILENLGIGDPYNIASDIQ